MKTLVVYYARTYTTELLASDIARYLGADIEVLIEAKKRLGPRPIRHLVEDIDARRRKLTSIQVQKSPQDYDLIVIGTPLLLGRITPEVRAYLASQNLEGKKVGFFFTGGGSGTEKVVSELKRLTPKSTFMGSLTVTEKEFRLGTYILKIKPFADSLKQVDQAPPAA